jgi:hypothetical protein
MDAGLAQARLRQRCREHEILGAGREDDASVVTLFGLCLVLTVAVLAWVNRDRTPKPKTKTQHHKERMYRSQRKHRS